MAGCGISCDPRGGECRCVPCRACGGSGQWEGECCNGSGGCSCRGRRVQMGNCQVCRGLGRHAPDADVMANVKSIAGMPFLGTGPLDRGW